MVNVDSDALTIGEIHGMMLLIAAILISIMVVGLAWAAFQTYKYDRMVKKGLDKQMKSDDKVIDKLIKEKLK